MIKATMSAYEYPYEEANAITKKIPILIDGQATTWSLIEDIATNNDNYIDLGKQTISSINKLYKQIKELFTKYPKVYHAVKNISGCLSNTGIHAGGVLVSNEKLIDYIPLEKGSDTAVLPLSQIDMDDIHVFGILKIDVLGLNNLTQIKKTMDLTGLDMDWFRSEDYSDPKVYETLRKGYTTDIFQCASPSATRLIMQMKVSSFDDLVIINAGNRPGPLSKNEETGKSMMDLIIEAKNNGTVNKLDERIDDIMKDSYGCLLYQEHAMLIAQEMAGYDLGGADQRIRKPLCKKKVELMPEIQIEFIYGKECIKTEITKEQYNSLDDFTKKTLCIINKEGKCILFSKSDKDSVWCKGAINRGYTEKFAIKIFLMMREFSRYAFNKSHSCAYAAQAYKNAYLSTYYPVEWGVGCTSCTLDDNDKIANTLSLCRKRGISILPPDVNKSSFNFSIDKTNKVKGIRYGLRAVKNVGDEAVNVIINRRPYESFDDFLDKVLKYTPTTNPVTGKKKNNPINKRTIESLIKVGALDCFETNRYKLLNHYMLDIRKEKKYESYNENEYKRKVKFQLEKELIGTYVSGHPLDPFPYTNLNETMDKNYVQIAGIVKKFTTKKTKNNKKYGILIFEAKDGKEYLAMLFGNNYTKYKPKCKKNSIIVIYGSYNMQYKNINCNRIQIVQGVKENNKKKQENLKQIQELEQSVQSNITLSNANNCDMNKLFEGDIVK